MTASNATYTATGQPKPTTASRRNFEAINDTVSTPIAPTAATTGSVGCGRLGAGAAARTAPTAVPGIGGGRGELIVGSGAAGRSRRSRVDISIPSRPLQNVPPPPDDARNQCPR